MRFLLNTNCWMQLIREREHAEEVRAFIKEVGDASLATTDMALHSIVIAMRRHKMLDKIGAFVGLSGIGASVQLVCIAPADLVRVADSCQQHGLDVEDAYQYIAAELHGLKLVSLDADFDKTPLGRLTPTAALQLFKDEQSQQK